MGFSHLGPTGSRNARPGSLSRHVLDRRRRPSGPQLGFSHPGPTGGGWRRPDTGGKSSRGFTYPGHTGGGKEAVGMRFKVFLFLSLGFWGFPVPFCRPRPTKGPRVPVPSACLHRRDLWGLIISQVYGKLIKGGPM